ncbi:MAG: monovalent cation/H(+) antiporter subunit G [Deferrisomatales bacterium]|nr:monovalent cation/H(+) antiporter subunit G [Deferrisomatales bacterium]
MNPVSVLSLGLLLGGAFFFVAGTVGLLRFPDVYTRLHALTKADNLGLGFVVLGLAVGAESAGHVVRLLLTWALVLVASATSAHLVARAAGARGVPPWTRP